MTQSNADSTEDPLPRVDPVDKTALKQAIRLRRLGMASLSHAFTLTLVCFCWWQKLLPSDIVLHFTLLSGLQLSVFAGLIKSGINLRFADPSLTLAQILLSILPTLYVIYHLDMGQARSVFLYLAFVPAIYGILALNTRQFIGVASWFVVGYGFVLWRLTVDRPEVLHGPLELIQFTSLVLVMSQVALIGGFINKLRIKLRQQNTELQTTTEQLEAAVEQVGELARRDELTGLYNRRHLFDVLDVEFNRMRRQPAPFSVCIIDIDFFKQVNDSHGHQAGDAVLCKVASEIEGSIRNIDCVGRYGGEEFLLILPQTELAGAMIKAERVRKQIENLRFPEISDNFNVTISIGIAEHNLDDGIDNTILLADEALYRAKDTGRNKTVSSPG